MRSRARHATLTFLALLVTIALVPIGCQGSYTVTGPSDGAVAPAANIAGTWSRSFRSDDSTGCGSSTATATFQQNGATVTGLLSTSSCGVTGYFKGTVQGNLLTGAVAMEGCVGGGASGTISGSELSLAIGDLTKPLITGDRIIMYGGVAALRR